jgi:hypothetical protein
VPTNPSTTHSLGLTLKERFESAGAFFLALAKATAIAIAIVGGGIAAFLFVMGNWGDAINRNLPTVCCLPIFLILIIGFFMQFLGGFVIVPRWRK